MSVAAGAGALTAVGAGLTLPTAAPVVCGGSERWPVKVGNDADAVAGKIDLNAGPAFSVAQINQQIQPGPYPVGSRMAVEKKQYTVRGYLAYFKQQTGADGDRDYHVVIADDPKDFKKGAPTTGPTMVVEFPSAKCFGGKHDTGPHTSALQQPIAEARATFEEHVKGLSEDKPIAQLVPVTVTGVGFFDRFTPNSHEPLGHAKVYAYAGHQYVLELHPVTEISFDNDPDSD